VRPNPAAAGSAERQEHGAKQIADVRGRITQLPAFERFVFVMAVLERYSIQECALLLDCSTREVASARIRALQLIAGVGKPSAPGSVIASFSAVSAQIAR
jgi:DNA-directed RNA polymerase specialized sigma24 family protein